MADARRRVTRLLARVLILAAPSVPLGLRGQVAIHTSGSGSRGEARPVAESGNPEGGALPRSRPPVTHPDQLLNWRPAPDLRIELSDPVLNRVVASWAEQAR